MIYLREDRGPYRLPHMEVFRCPSCNGYHGRVNLEATGETDHRQVWRGKCPASGEELRVILKVEVV